MIPYIHQQVVSVISLPVLAKYRKIRPQQSLGVPPGTCGQVGEGGWCPQSWPHKHHVLWLGQSALKSDSPGFEFCFF